MSFFRRIRNYFQVNKKQNQKTLTSSQILSNLLEKARRAQYDENYEESLSILENAMKMAEESHDSRSQIDINLSRADILMLQGDYKTAEFVLNELRQDSESRGIKAPLAYTLSSLGLLAQKRGKWEQSQEFYEQARNIGQGIKTDGATGRATAHLAEIYLHDNNANYAIYLLDDALPRLDKSGDRELLGHFQSLMGLAQIRSGNLEAGFRMMQKGLETAKQLQHRAQIRNITNILARELLKNGDYRKASHYLKEWLSNYPQSHDKNAEYGEILSLLARAEYKINDKESAKTHATEALALSVSLENETLSRQAKAILGLLFEDENALNYLQEARTAFDENPHDALYVEILRRIANIQNSESAYQEAIEAASEDPLLLAQAKSDLALFYTKTKRQREAINLWQEVVQAYQEANQAGQQARVYCELGALYELLGDGRMALREYGFALEQLSRIEDLPTRGLILANVSAAYSELGDVESAQDFFKESIEIAQRSKDLHAEALRRGNYGRYLALSNRSKLALSQLSQAISQSQKLNLKLETAIIRQNQGLAYSLQEEYQAAESSFQQAETDILDSANSYWQAVLYSNWGDSLAMQAKSQEAKSQYEKALSLAQAENHIALLVQSKLGLAEIAYQEKDFATAESILSEIESTSKRLFYKRLLALWHQTWSKIYAAQDKKPEAEIAWEEAKKLRSLMRMSPITADWL